MSKSFTAKLLERHAVLKAVVTEYNQIISEYQELNQTLDTLRRRFPEDFPPEEATRAGLPFPSAVPVIPRPALPTIQANPEALQGASDEEQESAGELSSPGKPGLSALAQMILSDGVPRHAKDLLIELRARNWKGSGDDKKDGRNISTTLTLRPTIFKNHGRNTWGLVIPEETPTPK